jgi:formate dehydrogenase subunit beta
MEALHFARQGGILERRYRTACQICDSPVPVAADVCISVLGMPVQHFVLVKGHDLVTTRALGLVDLTDGEATPSLIDQHERAIAGLTDRRHRVRQRVYASLDRNLPIDARELAKMMDECGACQECMDVCPICSVAFPARRGDGHYHPDDVVQWMISCAGCGMCEQACPKDLPLAGLFSRVQSALEEAYTYEAGRSFDEPLPVIQ